MVTADYVISTAYEGENGLVPGTITRYNDTPSERSERDESLVFCIKRKQLWLSRITQLEETIDSITVDSEDDNNVWGWELEEPMVQTCFLSALQNWTR